MIFLFLHYHNTSMLDVDKMQKNNSKVFIAYKL
jgi:hypothetical protein